MTDPFRHICPRRRVFLAIRVVNIAVRLALTQRDSGPSGGREPSPRTQYAPALRATIRFCSAAISQSSPPRASMSAQDRIRAIVTRSA